MSEMEAIREFVVRRHFLIGVLVTQPEYDGIKNRTLEFNTDRLTHTLAFIDGYLTARR